MNKHFRKIVFKSAIFVISLSIAWYLLKSGLLNNLVDRVLPVTFAAEILAGSFYTSLLTSPIAIAMLLILAQKQHPISLALIAGLGAALVDLMMVKFFRDNLNRDFNTIARQLKLDLINKFLKLLKLDFLIPLIGALIIASPLPDELGLFMLGASRLKYYQVVLLTFILNTAGILLIVTPINLLT